MGIRVEVKMPGIDRMLKIVADQKIGERVANAWVTIYRSFVRQRFARLSRGGGEWAPLKPSTIKRRRGGGGNAAILRDTGAMFAGLQPSLGGSSLLKSSPLKPVGFVATLESARQYKSGAGLADVAGYHHHGEGNLPARPILVQPPASTVNQMATKGQEIIAKALNDR